LVEQGDKSSRRGPRRVQAVEHAVDVLEYMAKVGQAIGVSDIARHTGLSKAAAHHLLATLDARRLVIHDAKTSLYRLGWNLYELGSVVVREVDVSRVARPFLDQLAMRTAESSLLGILDKGSVLYLDRAKAPSGFGMVAAAGGRSPLHATASGKLLLAFADSEIIDRVVHGPLERFTRTTVTDPKALLRQLAQIRTNGYASCWQECEAGLCSIAAPLRDYTGSVVASLALVGPAGRLTPGSVDTHLGPLRDVALEIATRLGAGQTAKAPKCR
jgi:IclR family transcriptional regulator, KDG regulon repressor